MIIYILIFVLFVCFFFPSGIMTARLLPSYLSCFDDLYISVRIAAVTTASKLLLEEEKVISKLLFLTQYDNNWRVKAHALKGKNWALVCDVIMQLTIRTYKYWFWDATKWK